MLKITTIDNKGLLPFNILFVVSLLPEKIRFGLLHCFSKHTFSSYWVKYMSIHGDIGTLLDISDISTVNRLYHH